MLSQIYKCMLLFEICLHHSSCVLIATDWSENVHLENLRLTTNIGFLPTLTAITCALECAINLPCMAYSYHAGNNTCLLYPIPFTEKTTGVIYEQGWKSYNPMFDNCPTALGYFYKRNLNMCYYLESEDLKDVNDAMLFCSIDGHMLRINTAEKQDHIVDFLFSRSSDTVYVGGLSESEDDMFTYEDGTLLTYFNWHTGNPKGERTIKMKDTFNYTWANAGGIVPKLFLCEITL